MGGEFDSRTYEGKHTKAQVLKLFKADVKEALHDEGHKGYSGTIAEKGHSKVVIKWIDTKVATEERAEKLISNGNGNWDEAMGVFYENLEEQGCVVGGWCSS